MLQDVFSNSPTSTSFFNRDWKLLGTRETLSNELSEILHMRPGHLHDFKRACVAAKLSWGAHLQAPCPEDRVYAMLNIVGVSMELRYGEGEEEAFRRLQETIIQSQNDESIFAWIPGNVGPAAIYSGLLATSIDEFAQCRNVSGKSFGSKKRFQLLRDGEGRAKGLELTMPTKGSAWKLHRTEITAAALLLFDYGAALYRCQITPPEASQRSMATLLPGCWRRPNQQILCDCHRTSKERTGMPTSRSADRG